MGHVVSAFDHVHIQGADPVSAMVQFVDGQPAKNNYRKRVLDADKTQVGADEAAKVREVIRRRSVRLQ